MTPRQSLAPMDPRTALARVWAESPPATCRRCGAALPRDPLDPRFRLCRRHLAGGTIAGRVQVADVIVLAEQDDVWAEPVELAVVGEVA